MKLVFSQKGQFAGKAWVEWIEQYEQGHQHPINRMCHYIGIPFIVLSLVLVFFAFEAKILAFTCIFFRWRMDFSIRRPCFW